MNAIRNITGGLLTGWHFMRWLRLALALFIAVQAIQVHDGLAGMIAVFLLFQVVTNTGCCGPQGCAVPMKDTPIKDKEIDFEEVVDSEKKS